MATTERKKGLVATPRSDRGYSCKVQQMVRQLEREKQTRGGGRGEKREKYQHRNWREVPQKDIESMGPVARSRYLAYEPTSKALQEKQQEFKKRVREKRAQQKLLLQDHLTLSQLVDIEKDYELVGQIKAAEARERVKILRQCYEKQQEEEVQRLVSSQPTSIDAVRLKTFLTPRPLDHTHLPPLSVNDPLTHKQRLRCRFLIEN